MLSAVVFTPDTSMDDDLAKQREIVVRSLVWLVSAVVSGLVRDVTLAVPAGLGLSEVADQSGCALVQHDAQADRLQVASAEAREERQIIMMVGYQPDASLIEEIDLFLRRESGDALAYVLGAPTTAVERLVPARRKVVGIVVTRAMVSEARGSFVRLARIARRQGSALGRARPMR